MRVGAAHAHCQPTSPCAPPPHLRAVGKVSKLRLPDDQGVRVLNGVACRNRLEREASIGLIRIGLRAPHKSPGRSPWSSLQEQMGEGSRRY